MPNVVRPMRSIQYDGTNGEHIAGTWCTGITFVSDTGTVLTYTDGDTYEQTMNVGEWLLLWEFNQGYPELATNAQYQQRYIEI